MDKLKNNKIKQNIISNIIEDKEINKQIDNKLKENLNNIDPILKDLIDEKIELNYFVGITDNYEIYLKNLDKISKKIKESDLEKIGFIPYRKIITENLEKINNLKKYYDNSYYCEIINKILKKKKIENNNLDLLLFDYREININIFPEYLTLKQNNFNLDILEEKISGFNIKDIYVGENKAVYQKKVGNYKIYNVEIAKLSDIEKLIGNNVNESKIKYLIEGENINLSGNYIDIIGDKIYFSLINEDYDNKGKIGDLNLKIYYENIDKEILSLPIKQIIEEKEVFLTATNIIEKNIFDYTYLIDNSYIEKIKKILPEIDENKFKNDLINLNELGKIKDFDFTLCNLGKEKISKTYYNKNVCELDELQNKKRNMLNLSIIKQILNSNLTDKFLNSFSIGQEKGINYFLNNYEPNLEFYGIKLTNKIKNELYNEKGFNINNIINYILENKKNFLEEKYKIKNDLEEFLISFINKQISKEAVNKIFENLNKLKNNKIIEKFNDKLLNKDYGFNSFEELNQILSKGFSVLNLKIAYELNILEERINSYNNFLNDLNNGKINSYLTKKFIHGLENRRKNEDSILYNGVKEAEFLTLQSIGVFDNKENLRETAKVYQFKKDNNTQDKINQFSLNNYSFSKSVIKQFFKDIELDNETNINDIKKLDNEIRIFNKLFFGKMFNLLDKNLISGYTLEEQKVIFFKYLIENFKDTIFKTRLLGRHNATGIFYPSIVNSNGVTKSILSIDPRNGYDSYIHEFGHFFDFRFSDNKGIGFYKVPISDGKKLFSKIKNNMIYNNSIINEIIGNSININSLKKRFDGFFRKINSYDINKEQEEFKYGLNYDSKTKDKILKIFNLSLTLNSEIGIKDGNKNKKMGQELINFYKNILDNGFDLNINYISFNNLAKIYLRNDYNSNKIINKMKEIGIINKEMGILIDKFYELNETIKESERLNELNYKEKYLEKLNNFISYYEKIYKEEKNNIIIKEYNSCISNCNEKIIKNYGIENLYKMEVLVNLNYYINNILKQDYFISKINKIDERDFKIIKENFIVDSCLKKEDLISLFIEKKDLNKNEIKYTLNKDFYSDIYEILNTQNIKKYEPLTGKKLNYYTSKTEIFAILFETYVYKQIFEKNKEEIDKLELFKKMKNGTWNIEDNPVISKIAYGSFKEEDIIEFEEILKETINNGFKKYIDMYINT